VTALLLSAVPAAIAALVLAIARSLAQRERLLLGAAVALFALAAVLSPQAPINDAWTHYLHLRAALVEPARLLDLWDRPGFTLVYAAPAALGLTAARLASLLVAALAVAATMRAARALGLSRPWCAGLLLAAQPDFFGQASSTMTELPAAAALAVALWGWAERRPWIVSGGLGWLAVTRPEGPLYAALGAAALLVRHRRVGPPAAALAPFAAYLAGGAAVFGDALWWIHSNPYRGFVSPRLELGRIPGSFFFVALRRGQSAILLVLEAVGTALAVSGRSAGLVVLLGPVATSFLLLTFLDIGLSATWLDSRYLVTVAPALALLAAAGLDAALAASPRLAPAALVALSAATAAWQLSGHWRVAGAGPSIWGVAAAAPLALAALLWRSRIPPRTAIAALLLLPLAASPPGAQAHHRPKAAAPARMEKTRGMPGSTAPPLSVGQPSEYQNSVPRQPEP
jgi:hypothetical protein